MGPLVNPNDDLVSKLAGYSSPASPSVGSNGAKGFDPWSFFVDLLKIGSNIYANNRNIELAREQNRWNLAQWQRENAYNTPVAQMARLAAAGINPALAYAEGGLMNESAASPEMVNGRVMSPIQIDPLTAAQVSNLDAQTQAIEHQTIREDQKQPVTLEIMGKEVSKLHNEVQAIQNSLSGIAADSDRKAAEATLVESTISYAIAKFKYESLMTQDQYSVYLKGLIADLGLKEAETAYIKSLDRLSQDQAWQVRVMTKIAKAYLQMDTARFKAESPYLVTNASSLSASLRMAAKAAGVEYDILSKLGEASAISSMLSSSFRDVGIGFGQGVSGFMSLKNPKPTSTIGFKR